METLGKIFGGVARVKVLRLFLCNPQTLFDAKTVASKARIRIEAARKELRGVESMGLIKKRVQKGKTMGYVLDPQFLYLEQLTGLLVDRNAFDFEDILARIKPIGKIKFLAVAGIFINTPESRVDLIIVGEKIKRPLLEDTIRKLEAEVGKELVYALFTTEEFIYRRQMRDKLVADIIDFPHEALLTTPEFSTLFMQRF